MATRSLRRVGDSTGKLIAAPDSVAELLSREGDQEAEPPDERGESGNHRTSAPNPLPADQL